MDADPDWVLGFAMQLVTDINLSFAIQSSSLCGKIIIDMGVADADEWSDWGNIVSHVKVSCNSELHSRIAGVT